MSTTAAAPSSVSYLSKQLQSPAYILENTVYHSRLLPRESAHTFVYPTLALLVSLSHLEHNSLDIAHGRIFHYNRIGERWWIPRLLSIRPGAYLEHVLTSCTEDNFDKVSESESESPTIRVKLESVLSRYGHNASQLGSVWMMTMPSYLGVEGVNPLTVYYCYKEACPELWLVVLEVHNTFSEQHVYVLPTGKEHEDENVLSGYDHSWTFPRQFHVSPFNDRLGFYQCSIVAPRSPPPSEMSRFSRSSAEHPVLPKIFLKILTPDVRDGLHEVKLTASFRATSSSPLTALGLLFALIKQPVSLLLTFPRIAYEAYQLHYKRSLDVFARPEPRAVDAGFEAQMPAQINPVQDAGKDVGIGGTVGWQCENDAMRISMFEDWLRRRAIETGITVTIQATDPKYGRKHFYSLENLETPVPVASWPQRHCQWIIRSSIVFRLLLMSPSAKHALLLLRDAEGLMQISDVELFMELFSAPDVEQSPTFLQSINQWMRCLPLPPSLRSDASYSEAIPLIHPMDIPAEGRWPWSRFRLLILTYYNFLGVYFFLLQLVMQKFLFVDLMKARFVPGTEPWLLWNRAAAAKKAF